MNSLEKIVFEVYSNKLLFGSDYHTLKHVLARIDADRKMVVFGFNDKDRTPYVNVIVDNWRNRESVESYIRDNIVPNWFKSYTIGEYQRSHILEMLEKATDVMYNRFETLPDEFAFAYFIHLLYNVSGFNILTELRHTLARLTFLLTSLPEDERKELKSLFNLFGFDILSLNEVKKKLGISDDAMNTVGMYR